MCILDLWYLSRTSYLFGVVNNGRKNREEQVGWKCNEILERNPIKFAGRRGFVNQVSRTRAEREDKLKRKTRVSLLVSMRPREREGETSLTPRLLFAVDFISTRAERNVRK